MKAALLLAAFFLGLNPSLYGIDVTGASSHLLVDPQAVLLKERIRPKALVLVSFEIGQVTGDAPGEAQLWVERKKLLERRYRIPGAFSPLYCDKKKELCLMIVGMGTANAATSVMALGLHQYLDLAKTYIMMAGIAGGNPAQTTLGSATWAEWVVDMDISHHIDPRDLPPGWEFGQFHLGCNQPWCNDGWQTGTEVYHLSPSLTKWAFQVSKDVKLLDSDQADKYRKHYSPEAAQKKPEVMKCDTVSGAYFHGHRMSNWANWWFQQWTGKQGSYCSAEMEDSGMMTAVSRLWDANRLDPNRVMILRTIANFDQGFPGQSEVDSVKTESGGVALAIENAFRVGSRVTDSVILHWSEYGMRPPSPSPE